MMTGGPDPSFMAHASGLEYESLGVETLWSVIKGV